MKVLHLLAILLVAPGLPATPLQAEPAASHTSAAALYNQGNAYARAGSPGKAVLQYERAQLLTPGDADIAANLDAVRRAQHLRVSPRSYLARLALYPTPFAAALAGLLGLALLASGGLLMPRISRSRSLPLSTAFLGLVLMGLPLGQAVLLRPLLHAAVVTTHLAAVRVAPVPMGETLFELHEAETVGVTGEHDDFVLIETETGRVGWVRSEELGRVVEPNG